MRIINVLEMDKGVPSELTSFPIYEEQLSSDVIEDAENFFIERISAVIQPDVLTEDDIEFYLDEASFHNKSGKSIYLIWS
jgi:hypothetical protein